MSSAVSRRKPVHRHSPATTRTLASEECALQMELPAAPRSRFRTAAAPGNELATVVAARTRKPDRRTLAPSVRRTPLRRAKAGVCRNPSLRILGAARSWRPNASEGGGHLPHEIHVDSAPNMTNRHRGYWLGKSVAK